MVEFFEFCVQLHGSGAGVAEIRARDREPQRDQETSHVEDPVFHFDSIKWLSMPSQTSRSPSFRVKGKLLRIEGRDWLFQNTKRLAGHYRLK